MEQEQPNDTTPPEPAQEQQPQESQDFGEGRQVLVIDDDPTSTTLVKNLLEQKGFHVHCLSNGQEAWDNITSEPAPCLIITDVIMPEMDGYGFLKQWRDNAEAKKNPLLVISARKNMEDTFLALGADGFLAKPLQTPAFLEKIKELAERVPKDNPQAPPEESESKESE